MSGTSTFHGLETARRAMTAHQAALYTTGHNIANANTPGYTRQRVNFKPTEAFPSPGFNKPNIPGQIGTGVKAGEVERVRQSFLDVQFRTEHNKNGYWSATHTALEKMEDILNEPTEDGIANTLDRFWRSLQDLSVHPEDSGARSVVRQRGMALAEKFNYTYASLDAIRQDYKAEIGIQVNQINSLTSQISSINEQIAAIEPHGYLSNDLYDKRDLLVDELSTYINIKVQEVASGGNSSDIAEGRYTIKLLDNNGFDMGYTLVDGSRLTRNELSVEFDDETGGSELAETVRIGNHTMRMDEFVSTGKLLATIEAYGYKGADGSQIGSYPEMQAQLDTMVKTFAAEFNRVHREGWSLSEIEAGEKAAGGGYEFFTFDPTDSAAKTLQVHADIYASLDNIAASSSADGLYSRMSPEAGGDTEFRAPGVTGVYAGADDQDLHVRWVAPTNDGNETVTEGKWEYGFSNTSQQPTTWTAFTETARENGLTITVGSGEPDGDTTWKLTNLNDGWNPSNSADNSFAGDGSNALALANVKDTALNFNGSTTNIQSYYQGVIGDMAVNTNEAERMTRNTETLRDSVEDRRQSISGVSLDEEMTDMIRFQHAYNAAARNITVIDEMLDRIINGMGIVGR